VAILNVRNTPCPARLRLSLVHLLAALCASQPCPGQQLLFKWDGVYQIDRLGIGVCGCGDVDQDGVADVAIGVPATYFSGRPGRVDLMSGRDGSLIKSLLESGSAGAFGESIALTADRNGDAIRELLIGAPLKVSDQGEFGAVYVVSPADGRIIQEIVGDAGSFGLGGSVDSGVDLNLDGIEDLLVGASGDDTNGYTAGAAYVYSGADGTVLFQLFGKGDLNQFGQSVAFCGDVDADGVADIGVGAPRFSTAFLSECGAGYVYSGKTGQLIFLITGSKNKDKIGAGISSAGDLNRDGYGDVIVGAQQLYSVCTGPGYAVAVSGKDASVLWSIPGDSDFDTLGKTVRLLGDLNQDGFADIGIGAIQADYGGCERAPGYLKLISGRSSALLYQFEGTLATTGIGGESFGFEASAVADVNRDGFPEVLIGAPDAIQGNESSAGRAYLFSGNDLFLQASPREAEEGDLLVLSLREQDPGTLAAIFLVEIQSVPYVQLLALGCFAPDLGFSFSATVPGGLAGLECTFQAFALSRGRIIDSAREVVKFR